MCVGRFDPCRRQRDSKICLSVTLQGKLLGHFWLHFWKEHKKLGKVNKIQEYIHRRCHHDTQSKNGLGRFDPCCRLRVKGHQIHTDHEGVRRKKGTPHLSKSQRNLVTLWTLLLENGMEENQWVHRTQTKNENQNGSWGWWIERYSIQEPLRMSTKQSITRSHPHTSTSKYHL